VQKLEGDAALMPDITPIDIFDTGNNFELFLKIKNPTDNKQGTSNAFVERPRVIKSRQTQ
jgi:hypothetical protein